MIHFVDLRPAKIPGVRFAFWDTIEDCFVTLGAAGDQGWGTWQEFVDDAAPSRHPDLRRFRDLAPAWVHEPMSQAEREGLPMSPTGRVPQAPNLQRLPVRTKFVRRLQRTFAGTPNAPDFWRQAGAAHQAMLEQDRKIRDQHKDCPNFVVIHDEYSCGAGCKATHQQEKNHDP